MSVSTRKNRLPDSSAPVKGAIHRYEHDAIVRVILSAKLLVTSRIRVKYGYKYRLLGQGAVIVFQTGNYSLDGKLSSTQRKRLEGVLDKWAN